MTAGAIVSFTVFDHQRHRQREQAEFHVNHRMFEARNRRREQCRRNIAAGESQRVSKQRIDGVEIVTGSRDHGKRFGTAIAAQPAGLNQTLRLEHVQQLSGGRSREGQRG